MCGVCICIKSAFRIEGVVGVTILTRKCVCGQFMEIQSFRLNIFEWLNTGLEVNLLTCCCLTVPSDRFQTFAFCLNICIQMIDYLPSYSFFLQVNSSPVDFVLNSFLLPYIFGGQGYIDSAGQYSPYFSFVCLNLNLESATFHLHSKYFLCEVLLYNSGLNLRTLY